MNPEETKQKNFPSGRPMQKEEPKKEPQISLKTFIFMLCAAILVDAGLGLIQLIPIAGSMAASVLNVLPMMGFWLWYRFNGISFAKPKKALSFFGAGLIEFIPILNVIPAWTAEIIYMYVQQAAEEKIELLKKGGAITTNILSKTSKTLSYMPRAETLTRVSSAATDSVSHMSNMIDVAHEIKKTKNSDTPASMVYKKEEESV